MEKAECDGPLAGETAGSRAGSPEAGAHAHDNVPSSNISLTKPDDPAAPATDSGAKHLSGTKLWLVVASVTLVTFLMLLDVAIIVTAIPVITDDFRSLSDVGWYGSVYLLASCPLQPLAGKLYTQLRSKYTFLAFLAVFELGSVLCGAARSSNMLIVGRAIAGIGSAGLINGALTILSASAPVHQQPILIGAMMGIGQLGIICGPLIGGAFTERVSWRWCFYINLPIGAVASAVLLAINIPSHHRKGYTGNSSWEQLLSFLSTLDLVGFVLFASFAVMISLGLEWGASDYPWNSAVVIGLLCGGACALVVFAAWESRMGDQAMIPPSVAGRREVWSSCLFFGFFAGSMLTFTYYLPIYFQAALDVSPLLSGVYVLPSVLPQMLMLIVSGGLIMKLGYYIPWAAASGVLVCVSAGLLTTLSPRTSTAAWVGYQVLGAVGRGCGMQTPVIAIQNTLPAEQNSIGMSLVVFAQTFGGSIFLTCAEIIFSSGLISGLAQYAPSVDAQAVISAGATAFRQFVEPEQVAGVSEAFCLGVGRIYYLALGGAAATLFFCWGMGWRRVSKKRAQV